MSSRTRRSAWLAALTILLLLAVPALAQQPQPESGIAPAAAEETGPLNALSRLPAWGRLYLTDLNVGDGGAKFMAYNPATKLWVTLDDHDTGCQMAVDNAGSLYSLRGASIERYDPAADTWSYQRLGPPGATGLYCNLEVTNSGGFLYTEAAKDTLWYTSGTTWYTRTLPFAANVMGDYDPATNQYVIGQWNTTNAYQVNLSTWATTKYTSTLGNGEYARFGAVTAGRYYFQAGSNPIHYFSLSNPALPPVNTSAVPGWYTSAAADRQSRVIYVASLDGTKLWAFDQWNNSLAPLAGGGTVGHSSLAMSNPCPDWQRMDAEWAPSTGKAYILGGRGGSATHGDIYAVDPAQQTCADTGRDMLTPISNYTIAPLGGLLCTFGGRDAAGNMIRTVQCYDPVHNTMTTKAQLPDAFTGYMPGGVAVVGNKAYIFGGYRTAAAPYTYAGTWEYDLTSNSYTQKGDMALARAYIDAAVVDGKIYAFGGDTYDGASLIASTKAEVFNPAVGTWNDAAVADLPLASGEGRAQGFGSSAAHPLAGRVVIAGGGQWSGEWAEVVLYDTVANTYDYSTLPDLQVARRDFAAFYVPGNPGQMWAFGGHSVVAPYGGDVQPHAPPEQTVLGWQAFLPLVVRH